MNHDNIFDLFDLGVNEDAFINAPVVEPQAFEFTLIISSDIEFYIYLSEFDNCYKFWSNVEGIENRAKSMAELLDKAQHEVDSWAKELAEYGTSPFDVYRGPNQWPPSVEYEIDGF